MLDGRLVRELVLLLRRVHVLHPLLLHVDVVRRSLHRRRVLVAEHEHHALVLAVQPVDILEVPVRRLGVDEPDELGKRVSRG